MGDEFAAIDAFLTRQLGGRGVIAIERFDRAETSGIGHINTKGLRITVAVRVGRRASRNVSAEGTGAMDAVVKIAARLFEVDAIYFPNQLILDFERWMMRWDKGIRRPPSGPIRAASDDPEDTDMD